MRRASTTGRAPWASGQALACRETYGASDLITEGEFRRHIASRFASGNIRAEMDKLKKVLVRAVKQGEISPVSGALFQFGDLVGAVARSRSQLASAAQGLPHTRHIAPDGFGRLAHQEECHVLMAAPTSIGDAARQIALMACEIQRLAASEKSLHAQLRTLKERRVRCSKYGQLGGRPKAEGNKILSRFEKG